MYTCHGRGPSRKRGQSISPGEQEQMMQPRQREERRDGEKETNRGILVAAERKTMERCMCNLRMTQCHAATDKYQVQERNSDRYKTSLVNCRMLLGERLLQHCGRLNTQQCDAFYCRMLQSEAAATLERSKHATAHRIKPKISPWVFPTSKICLFPTGPCSSPT